MKIIHDGPNCTKLQTDIFHLPTVEFDIQSYAISTKQKDGTNPFCRRLMKMLPSDNEKIQRPIRLHRQIYLGVIINRYVKYTKSKNAWVVATILYKT